MITFHDWIVSGGNRLSLLADALAAAGSTARRSLRSRRAQTG